MRRASASYSSDLVIARQWAKTAGAAVYAASMLPAGPNVTARRHVLTAGAFMVTLAVEATIHHLDMLRSERRTAGRSPPDAGWLLSEPVPAAWDDAIYALKGTSRARHTTPVTTT